MDLIIDKYDAVITKISLATKQLNDFLSLNGIELEKLARSNGSRKRKFTELQPDANEIKIRSIAKNQNASVSKLSVKADPKK